MKKLIMMLGLVLCLTACGGTPKTVGDIPGDTKLQIVGVAFDMTGNGLFVAQYDGKYGLIDVDDNEANYMMDYIETYGYAEAEMFNDNTKIVHWENSLEKLEKWGDKNEYIIQPAF
jgi:hypothetical protein